MAKKVYVFILSWERPKYLWASLDSLYCNTKHPCNFVLIDNASQDPMVRQIIDGFDRRGMFHALHFMEKNHPDSFEEILKLYSSEIEDYFVYVESDVVIYSSENCWLSQMTKLMDDHPQLAMLGSRIDTKDFIEPEFARRQVPDMLPEQFENLIKAESPERERQNPAGEFSDFPLNPPGRLTLLRLKPLMEVGFQRDSKLHKALRARDYDTGIAYNVVHRHLSLLNFYDYPEYDFTWRQKFFDREIDS